MPGRKAAGPGRAAPEGQVDGEAPEGEAKPNETSAERFTRLAKARMTNALFRIDQVAKLGGATYESTPEQQAKILSSLRSAVAAVEEAFKPKAKGKQEFDF